MVTTTVRMLHGVAGNTTNLGPAVALSAEAVVRVTSLEDWLLNTTTTTDDTDHRTAAGRDGLLLTARELQASATSIDVVRDDDAVVTASARKCSTIASLCLNVADDATVWDVTEGENVANGKWGLGTAEDGLASEHTLWGNEELLRAAEFVRVTELNTCEWGTAAGFVLNGLHNATHETLTFGVIEDAEFGWAEALVPVDLVDGALALTAGKNDLSHIVQQKGFVVSGQHVSLAFAGNRLQWEKKKTKPIKTQSMTKRSLISKGHTSETP